MRTIQFLFFLCLLYSCKGPASDPQATQPGQEAVVVETQETRIQRLLEDSVLASDCSLIAGHWNVVSMTMRFDNGQETVIGASNIMYSFRPDSSFTLVIPRSGNKLDGWWHAHPKNLDIEVFKADGSALENVPRKLDVLRFDGDTLEVAGQVPGQQISQLLVMARLVRE